MSNEVIMLAQEIGLSLAGYARAAQHRIVIACPFIKRKALERLIADVAPSVNVTVFTRWAVDEIRSGVSDLTVFNLLRERDGTRLLLHGRLHAKIVLIDDEAVVIGSANVTDAALGFAESANAEVMVCLRPVPNRLFLFLRQIEIESIPATEELQKRFEDAANSAPLPLTPPNLEIAVTSASRRSPFPSFRNPERLYQGYRSVTEFNDPEMRAAVLDDLVTLALPDGLDESSFRQRVGSALLSIELLSALDAFVSEPKFFGEITDWLKKESLLAGQSHDVVQRYLQTVIRWFRYFLPGGYRFDSPDYSDVFRLV